MFPNPQSALPLPPRPNLDQYKKLAKELTKACNSREPEAIRNWAQQWIKALVKLSGLIITPGLPVEVEAWIDQVEDFARRQLSVSGSESAQCRLSDAHFVIARSHGFESWPRFARYLQQLLAENSSASQFESAADAVVSGDIAALQSLLQKNPALIRERSSREHQATLLHYVSANGVEGYRQKTPPNIVEIAKTLLAAGAEVDATAHVYGGESTALELAATSIHPVRAGVQAALLTMLLDHGASLHGRHGRSIVVACLANGRHEAAIFLAGRGASLDPEAAVGIGRLDVVRSFFSPNDGVKNAATAQQLQRGFLWACEFGHDDVVQFLLDQGADIRGQSDLGQSGLHMAVVGGHLSTIKLLLLRGAPLEDLNTSGGTVLGQALWSFLNRNPAIDDIPILETLLAASAKIEEESISWLEKQPGRTAVEKGRVVQLLRRYGAAT